MDRQKKLYIGKVAIWTAFLILIVLIAYNLQAGNFNGKTGAQGLKGATVIGPKGDKGDPAHTPILGVDYFIKNGINGTNGKDGVGRTGPAGKDAPVDNPPMIVLVDLNGSVTHPSKCVYNYTFSISVNVSDQDLDALHTKISYLDNGVYILVGEYLDRDTFTASASLLYHSPAQNLTISWLVESWDGTKITNFTQDYTIEV
jgi:hypothetical protein